MFTLWLADITEPNLPKSCCISFPDGNDDLMNFEVTFKPDEGDYKGGKFVFSFQVSPLYPHDAPKVKGMNTMFGSAINLSQLTQPNHEDPPSSDAADVLRDDPNKFKSNVKSAVSGGSVGDVHFSSLPNLAS
ncbi:hypothetical protein SADUNF_Sadunf14G0025500 [Salix dunnii]|uniref:UBC core domain-containing protein n=1 Tax=Salix dunnii TaxID=1413687 RepID=A0A835MT58_9ROSI|nr:hypothetical protein SADUNF_Sadunf14G0025500 [Salix dunnii]